MNEKPVDYLELIARAAAEDRAECKSVMPEPAGEQVVDYMAVSKAWQEQLGRMDSGKDIEN